MTLFYVARITAKQTASQWNCQRCREIFFVKKFLTIFSKFYLTVEITVTTTTTTFSYLRKIVWERIYRVLYLQDNNIFVQAISAVLSPPRYTNTVNGWWKAITKTAEGRVTSKVLIKNLAFFFLCPSQQFLPTSSKFSCVGIPARAAWVQHMISCTLQPLYKRVLIYSAFLWSGYERIVVYFAPNI